MVIFYLYKWEILNFVNIFVLTHESDASAEAPSSFAISLHLVSEDMNYFFNKNIFLHNFFVISPILKIRPS